MSDMQALVPQTFEKFKVVGEDGLHFIPKSTMAHALQSLNLNPPITELRQAIDDADVNGDGAIDQQEFEDFVKKYSGTLTDIGRCIDNFMELDSDKNGILDKDELRGALRLAGGDSLNDAEFNAMWESIDIDRSGEITIEEFVCAMCDGATREQVREELRKRDLEYLCLGVTENERKSQIRKIEVEEVANRSTFEDEYAALFDDFEEKAKANKTTAKERELKRIEQDKARKEDERKRKEEEERKKQEKAKAGCC